MTAPLRLMAILAHPDDESLGFGGVLVHYARQGVETSLVTATRGDGGRWLEHRAGDPEHPGREALGRIREAELREAIEVLGVRDLTVLGLRDGGVDQADPIDAIARIAAEIRRLRPQVVLTFPPDGSYGHPDHIAISQLAASAMVAAADPSHDGSQAPHAVAKFYYMVSTERSMEIYQQAFKKLSSMVDGVERNPVPWPDWGITTLVDVRAHWRTVWKAASCHVSQVSNFEKLKVLTEEQHEELWGRASFYRVFSTVNGGRRREDDLFEGLRT